MSVWKKLITAVKGGATEAAQSVADSQAIRILEQEIREAHDRKKQKQPRAIMRARAYTRRRNCKVLSAS